MPCIGGPIEPGSNIYDTLRDDRDMVTRLLCEVLTKLDEAVDEGIIVDNIWTHELEIWWQKHKKLDVQRRLREAELELTSLKSAAAQIVKLGGEPGKKLLKNIEKKEAAIHILKIQELNQ